jgi:hypothetical protein
MRPAAIRDVIGRINDDLSLGPGLQVEALVVRLRIEEPGLDGVTHVKLNQQLGVVVRSRRVVVSGRQLHAVEDDALVALNQLDEANFDSCVGATAAGGAPQLEMKRGDGDEQVGRKLVQPEVKQGRACASGGTPLAPSMPCVAEGNNLETDVSEQAQHKIVE